MCATIVCKAGDCFIHNRQAVHGSFANTSGKPRGTFQFGYHRRKSLLGVTSKYMVDNTLVQDGDRRKP